MLPNISPEMKSLASRALSDPASLTLDEIEQLGGCIMGVIPNAMAARPPGAHSVYNALAMPEHSPHTMAEIILSGAGRRAR